MTYFKIFDSQKGTNCIACYKCILSPIQAVLRKKIDSRDPAMLLIQIQSCASALYRFQQKKLLY